MHFKIDRTVFLNELYSLQGVAGAKQVIPILSHLLIETRMDWIGMRATDLDLTIATECDALVREEGLVCLPARKLMEIVKSLEHGEVEVKVNGFHQAMITSNGSRFKLNGVEAASFPERKEFEGEYAEISADLFSRFIPRVIHAVRQEASPYALNGAKLEVSGARIRMVATDGHRLALVEHDGQFGEELDVLIPKKTLAELARLCAGFDGEMQIGKSDNHIHFKLGKREVVSCLLSGQYPDYAKVLPTDNHNRFTVGRDAIHPAVKRVSLMADDRSRAIKLEIGEGQMNISSQAAELGEAGETVAIDYAGDAIVAGFNATYLNDLFSAIEEDEILFEFKNGESQTQISVQTAHDDRHLAVVMPMRF
ncbi:MAG TPA: DNA polymerase III subunit beta [Pyrinomonadaceae bacterium]|nr:DNA polymerase III subunit beta [Pyrinomonadaceae bacterium]